MNITEIQKKYIWEKYHEIESKDIKKEYLEILSHDNVRANKAYELFENFKDEELDFDGFNFMILASSIIIELEL